MKRIPPIASCLLVFAFMASPGAWAATWFALDTDQNDSALEVDLTSLRWRGENRELRVRLVYEQPRQQVNGVSFRSVLAALEVNCQSGLAFWRHASFHADSKAEDRAVAEETYGAGLPASHNQALIPEKTWTTLVRSACAQPRPPLL